MISGSQSVGLVTVSWMASMPTMLSTSAVFGALGAIHRHSGGSAQTLHLVSVVVRHTAWIANIGCGSFSFAPFRS